MSEEVKFECVVAKVQTLADNGIRVWLDLSEGNVMQLAQLAECQRVGAILKATLIPEKIKENGRDSTEKRPKTNY